ncbi:MAG: HU family DNA-binding protein [Bacteroidales bacterium]|jgi:DNA-binding protein HU-beta|nr:HU family DNA-binding protein [Bacteroidales bacterium]
MNKSELINAMADNSGLSKTDAKKALDAFINVTTDTLKNGEKISLIGFGTFGISERKARVGLNPLTKEKIEIPAKKVIKFKPGADLK